MMSQKPGLLLPIACIIILAMTIAACAHSTTMPHTPTTTAVPQAPCTAATGTQGPILPASPKLVMISSDPFTTGTAEHATEIEPASFACGQTIVTSFQIGRFKDGGSIALGWATSQDGGGSWHHGIFPALTTTTGGIFARISNSSVAYDAAHKVWLVSSLALNGDGSANNPVNPVGIVVNRSLDDGLTWSQPVIVYRNDTAQPDKGWIRCDNFPTSPYFGHCYTAWHDQYMQMSTSDDGGLTWSANQETADKAQGVSSIPLIEPNGLVVVPFTQYLLSTSPSPDLRIEVSAFTSSSGGKTWGKATRITNQSRQTSGQIIEADENQTGQLVVVWRGPYNYIATSPDGLTWSAPMPITMLNVSSFVMAVGIDPMTNGNKAHLVILAQQNDMLTIKMVAITSEDTGKTWSQPVTLASMDRSWLVESHTLFGDYVTISFVNGHAVPIFPVGIPPQAGRLNEAIYTLALS